MTWELEEASSDDVLQSLFIYGTSNFLDWPTGHCISHNFSPSLLKIGSWFTSFRTSDLFSSLFLLLISNFFSLSVQGLYPFYYLLFLIYISLLFFSCWVVYRFSLEMPLNITFAKRCCWKLLFQIEIFSLLCKYLEQKQKPEAWNAHLWQIKPLTLFVLKQWCWGENHIIA